MKKISKSLMCEVTEDLVAKGLLDKFYSDLYDVIITHCYTNLVFVLTQFIDEMYYITISEVSVLDFIEVYNKKNPYVYVNYNDMVSVLKLLNDLDSEEFLKIALEVHQSNCMSGDQIIESDHIFINSKEEYDEFKELINIRITE